MSLFKSREWWYTSVGADEEFDTSNIAIGNIDNSPDESGGIMLTLYYIIIVFTVFSFTFYYY